MAVDHAGQLGVAALQRADVDELLDELGRLRADDVAAEQLAVLLLADDLDQAGAVAVDGAGADRAVLQLADDDVVAGLLGLRLGEAEARHVRGAERRAWDVDVADRVGLHPVGVLDRDDALVAGLVGERGAGDEVADRPDAGDAGLQRAVDLDEALLGELDADGVEPEALDVGAAAGGDDEPFGLAILVAVGAGHAVGAALDVL